MTKIRARTKKDKLKGASKSWTKDSGGSAGWRRGRGGAGPINVDEKELRAYGQDSGFWRSNIAKARSTPGHTTVSEER